MDKYSYFLGFVVKKLDYAGFSFSLWDSRWRVGWLLNLAKSSVNVKSRLALDSGNQFELIMDVAKTHETYGMLQFIFRELFWNKLFWCILEYLSLRTSSGDISNT